jgi:predicted aminopeptidase
MGRVGRLLSLAAMAVAAAACSAGDGAGEGAGVNPDQGDSPLDALGYYAQSIAGHLDLMRKARPVADWLADPNTPPALRERLLLAQSLREFAVRELSLPDNASYRRYAELGRPAAVWNVVAAPELSLKLKTWCFPVLGCVGYRGYFDRAEADTLVNRLRDGGWEAGVYGVPAYSTLGWSNWIGGDPLLNTFLRGVDAEVARLIFHELAHQVLYAGDDTMFNESFATAVERIGVRRWLQSDQATPAAREAAVLSEQRRSDFRALTRSTREALERLYASDKADSEKRATKAELMTAMRAEHQRLKLERWGGYAGYDNWFANANNASLGVQAAYDEWVPAFERLFAREGSDFGRFYAAVKVLAALPPAERHATLQDLP